MSNHGPIATVAAAVHETLSPHGVHTYDLELVRGGVEVTLPVFDDTGSNVSAERTFLVPAFLLDAGKESALREHVGDRGRRALKVKA